MRQAHGTGAGSGAAATDAAPDGTIRITRVHHDDHRMDGLLAGLLEEYTERYGARDAAEELARYPVTEFAAPRGRVVLAEMDGQVVAGGALRPYEDGRTAVPDTAEFKRVWTSHRHRRRGLARRIMAALEGAARDLGYTRVRLFTGPSQPEAIALYDRLGYRRLERHEVAAWPYVEAIGFTRDLDG
ncbi:GNAT family N-acetyltransferase [Nocardiopsis sp. CNR-923]|uniref:GNAT family N-acetyltransferase n=1 Tax=Nocardiopsis sp. CNR-923 TaxID=1904965 RepID=UPI000965CE14|nr:GNAT family N-acetyltransferase [Nocardiopsis sp. CNR-923]OLT29643.1 GNAT family N-acetyltransferase [Nocardiopsis sp. CNR-923]